MTDQRSKQETARLFFILFLTMIALGIAGGIVLATPYSYESFPMQILGSSHYLIATFLFFFTFGWGSNDSGSKYILILISIVLSVLFFYAYERGGFYRHCAIGLRLSYGLAHLVRDEIIRLDYAGPVKKMYPRSFLWGLLFLVIAYFELRIVGFWFGVPWIFDLGIMFFKVAAPVFLLWLVYLTLKKKELGWHAHLNTIYFVVVLGILVAISWNRTWVQYFIPFINSYHFIVWLLIYSYKTFEVRNRPDLVAGPKFIRSFKTSPMIFIGVVGALHLIYWGVGELAIYHGWLVYRPGSIGDTLATTIYHAEKGGLLFAALFDARYFQIWGIVHTTLSWRISFRRPLLAVADGAPGTVLAGRT